MSASRRQMAAAAARAVPSRTGPRLRRARSGPQDSAPTAGTRAPATPAPEAAATRDQLLAAAAAVFSECGFRDATVREICARASANVAAVNYHFGGKEGLYSEVLRRNYRESLRRFPPDGGVPPGAPPEARLRGFVGSFVQRIFADGVDSCHGRLLARELVEPTPALDALVAGEVRTLAEHLMGIVRELLPAGHDALEARLCMASVVSQIVFYMHCQPVIRRLFPELSFDASRLEDLADHITRFSLAGIRESAGARGRRHPAAH